MKIIRNLRKEVNENIPDLSDKIESSVDWNAVAGKRAKANAKTHRKPFGVRFGFGLAGVAAVLIAAIVLPFALKPATVTPAVSAGYEVVISVNPAVQLTVDKDDNVIKQTGLNEDGVNFLYGSRYTGKKIDVATREICDELKKINVLTDGKRISLTAYDTTTREILRDKQNEVMTSVMNVISDWSSGIVTKFLDDDELDALEEYYENHHIKDYAKSALNDLKSKLKNEVDKKMQYIDTFLKEFAEVDDNSSYVTLSADMILQLNYFGGKYGFDLGFTPLAVVRGKDIVKLKEELADCREDLEECLEEIDDTDEDDFGDALSDLLDIMKEDIFNRD